MRKFRGGREDPGQLDPRPLRRRTRWVLTGSLLAGGLVAGTAGLVGISSTSGAGELASFDVGRLTSIASSPNHDKNGAGSPSPSESRGPKGAPAQSRGPKGAPLESPAPDGKGSKETEKASAEEGKRSKGKGPGGRDWEYGPHGCEPDDAAGDAWTGKGPKGTPEGKAADAPPEGKEGDASSEGKEASPEGKDAKGAPLPKDATEDKKRPGGHRDDWDPRCGSDASDHEVTQVPCDSDELIAALVRANAAGGGTLKLTADCTYTLTAYDEHKGRHEDHNGRDNGWGGAGNGSDAVTGNGGTGTVKEKSGLPLITQPIRIKGEGATITRPVNVEAFRFFTVRDGGELKLSDVTLENGRAAEGGSIKVEFGGVAVIEHTEITQSVADSPYGGGGAIFNDGRVTLIKSRLSDNSAAGVAGRGGGILNGGILTVEKSELVDNSANGYGGAVANHRATAGISQSELTHNTAAEGGAIASYSSRTKVWASKISHNTARFGGGIAAKEGTLAVRHAKISDNIGLTHAGGIAAAGGVVAVDDSLIKANTTFGNGGGIAAQKANLIVRGTEIVRNDAVGPDSVGGGIAVDRGKLSLFDSEVSENEATNEPGGIFANKAEVKVDEETVIIKNQPTNCEGSPEEIPNCFG